MRWGRVAALLGVFFGVALADGQVRLPAFFQDHMVVQRNAPVHVWGNASPGEAISVSFRGTTAHAVASDIGRWSIYLPAGTAGGPFEMDVQGSNRIVLTDILVGDVWIASGQSNMEFPMAKGMNRGVNNEKEEIAAANYPRIRLLVIQRGSSDSPQENLVIWHPWSACTPARVADFSAVGYFFARDLQQHLHIPLGIIDDTWGGTPAEAWTSLDALSADASLMPVFARRAQLMDGLSTLELEHNRLENAYQKAKAAGKDAPLPPWIPEPTSWKPAGLYNAMIAPLTPFPIKGVIWYQGESNDSSDAAPLYGRLFRTMIEDWRNKWGEGDFPFLYVQIANFDPGATWPVVREGQRSALALRNTAMAVTIDIGDPINIHPKDKQDVGLRLSLAARALAYGEHIEYSGPLPLAVTVDGSQLRVQFDHAKSGLTAKMGTLRGFELAGADKKYVPAQARIEGDRVIVSAESIDHPVYVRYGWAANPDCNLYNGAGLPASPFEARGFDGSPD